MKFAGLATTIGIAILPASLAQAATLSYSAAIDTTATDWQSTLSLGQFDTTLGTLNSVRVTLDGTVTGEIAVENLSSSARDATMNLAAQITAATGDISLLVEVNPIVTTTVSLAAFDGTVDFGGDSGFQSGTGTGNDSALTLLTGADMDAFKGTGLIDIVLNATAQSGVTGGGNILFSAETLAGARIAVTYDYDTPGVAPVPLPASLPLLGGAIGLIGFSARRRRS